MADRPHHIEDETAWKIYMREARRARLRSLADSVNDTARAARNSLSLLLIVALYLGLTLVASTDENLLRNGQVVLPQVGVGLSVVQSYVFAPPIFLYLHAQLLFQLTVLARKVRTFEVALKEEFPGAASLNKQREECRDWLSAFAFVQLFQIPPGVPHVSKVLAWFGVEAVPVVLLFVLDLSFIRYQSFWVTGEHHIIFVVDLVFLAWFNWQVFGRESPRLWTYLKKEFLALWTYLSEPAGELVRRLTSPHTHKRTPHTERRFREMLGRIWGVVAFVMALLLISFAHPPSFDPETVREDRMSIWNRDVSSDPEYFRRSWINSLDRFLVAAWERKNPLDAGPCEWWGLACRYLDVGNKRLVKTQAQDMSSPKSDELSDESFTTINLAERNLRFANFRSAHLQGANLGGARLQGANLVDAQLQGARLVLARLQGANLGNARLQGANLGNAQLQGANLGNARLQGANLRGASLPGANLRGASLPGANLKVADLLGANLQEVKLPGANLQEAELQCANLGNARLQGANLGNARLQGANLGNAQLQGGSGKPDSWYLVWAPSVSYDFPADRPSYLNTLFFYWGEIVNLAWEREMSLKEYLQKCIEEDRKPRDPLPDNFSQPDWNAWAEWTAEFACEDEYTARSSLRRWMSEEPLSGLEDSDRTEAKKLVREALADVRKTKTEYECPGLHSISDDEWREFIEGRGS